jgi:hypothetical protein
MKSMGHSTTTRPTTGGQTARPSPPVCWLAH